jgi:hypothetical protein
MGSAQASSSSLEAVLARPGIWRGCALGQVAHASVSSGFAVLDAALPGGGWPAGALTELMPSHEGIGELRLLGPALASLAAQGRGLAWIAPPYLPYAPALAAAGIELARLLIVKTRTPQETLWAFEQALASNACGAVLAWVSTIKYPALRRLQLAAEGSRALALAFRPPSAAQESSPAALRLALDTAPGGLAVRVLKRRGALLDQPILLPSTLPHAVARARPAEPTGRDLHPRLALV